MEDLYSLHPTSVDYSEHVSMTTSPVNNLVSPTLDYQMSLLSSVVFRDHRINPIFGSGDQYHHHQLFSTPATAAAAAAAAASSSTLSETGSIAPPREIHGRRSRGGEEIASEFKAKIASHPRYPSLLEAYIDCQKVGAPPEVACLLDEIRQENDVCKRSAVSTRLGVDPELDEFMETYCDVLVKYKSDLARPFDEATTFLNKIQMQLTNLCNNPPSSRTSLSASSSSSTIDS